MRIVVTQAPPIDSKHGVVAGNEYDAAPDGKCVWIETATGEQAKLFPREFRAVRIGGSDVQG